MPRGIQWGKQHIENVEVTWYILKIQQVLPRGITDGRELLMIGDQGNPTSGIQQTPTKSFSISLVSGSTSMISWSRAET